MPAFTKQFSEHALEALKKLQPQAASIITTLDCGFRKQHTYDMFGSRCLLGMKLFKHHPKLLSGPSTFAPAFKNRAVLQSEANIS